ncbi:MAG: glycosyltransferase family 2 protein [Porticoccus sp.]|nr:glycosyltransferase family 2 protein [Porticoccus sp.]MBQ0807571.1 glycosyltransferase family 2 protein [Porticoccus sp.]
MRLCVIIPVYNHPEYLARLVNRLHEYELPVILIDDGSESTCQLLMARLANEFENVQLAVHHHNKGKGAAIKSGLHFAEQLGYTHALQVDADGQHDLNDIPKFKEAVFRHPDALITGYPEYDDTVPKLRYYGRYGSHIWVWINTLSTLIIDSMCGYRIYPVVTSNQLLAQEIMGDRMDFDGEFIVRWCWSGQPLEQIQTRVVYPDNGVSHFHLFNDNKLISWMHMRLFFGMLQRMPKLLLRKWQKK